MEHHFCSIIPIRHSHVQDWLFDRLLIPHILMKIIYCIVWHVLYTSLCNVMQRTFCANTIQYDTIWYNTIQYNIIQYNTIQSNTIWCDTIPYTTQCFRDTRVNPPGRHYHVMRSLSSLSCRRQSTINLRCRCFSKFGTASGSFFGDQLFEQLSRSVGPTIVFFF